MTAVVLRADARRLPLPDGCVDLIVTSPPYWVLRDYGYPGQLGSEATPQEWLANLIECTAEWVRVLKPSGSIFVNLGDKFSTGNSGESGMAKLGEKWAGGGHSDAKAKRRSAAVPGYRPKSLLGLPWRYALACMDELGLILRRDIIWSKPNGLPESVTDRCRSSHEYLFHLVKQPRYYAAVDEIREPHTGTTQPQGPRPAMRSGNGVTHRISGTDGTSLNPLGKLPGSVWSIPSQPLVVPAHLGVDHFAAFPLELPRRIIAGWSPPGICTACGEGRRPVSVQTKQTFYGAGRFRSGAQQVKDGAATVGWAHDEKWRTTTAITGYACACPLPDAPTTPAVIVDPFGGTGSTALVASVMGRLGFSFDLSMDYARLARWRTRDRAEIAKAMQVPKPPPVPDGQEALFT